MSGQELLITRAQADQIFGTPVPARSEVVELTPFVTEHAVAVQFSSTTLGLESGTPTEDAPEAKFRVVGNSVPRICPAAECTVSVCGLGRQVMSDAARRDRDCAAANTLLALPDRPGYVMTPISSGVVFLADAAGHKTVTALNENGIEQTMFRKLNDGCTVVVSEHDVPEGAEGVTIIANTADSAVGVATTEIEGIRYAIPLHSYQPHLGDRGPDDQILAKALDAILDRHQLTDEARQRAIQSLTVQVDIGFAASLRNFGHEVRVPRLTLPAELQGADPTTLPAEKLRLLDGESRYAIKLMGLHGHADPSHIRPKDVMNDQYPGALEHGEIYPELEAKMGIDAPYTDGGCPGDGQLCHIDYPGITRRTLIGQLVAMGVSPDNVHYNDSQAVDTASSDNRLASNRLAQLAGIPKERTLRTASAIDISFPLR